MFRNISEYISNISSTPHWPWQNLFFWKNSSGFGIHHEGKTFDLHGYIYGSFNLLALIALAQNEAELI